MVEGVKRISTGIRGLDKLTKGFVQGDVYFITGGTGSGKTIFCCQFIHEGLKNNEKCIFFSLEERPDSIMNDADSFEWDFRKSEKSGRLLIEYRDPFETINIASAVKNRIENFNATRVVIDSTSLFGIVFKDENEMRRQLYELIKLLKETNCVTLLTGEIPSGSDKLSRFGVEEFVADGVIVLHHSIKGRSLFIKKMRKTKHDDKMHAMRITSSGIEVAD
ncbi:MAG: ATPase domain-containing protein [Candidatus Aenigmatarchaeota archaeon]